MENSKLIRKIAKSFSGTTGIDYDDLFQEGYLAYLEAMNSYDASKGKISTHVWHCVHNRLKNYIKEEQKEQAPSIDDLQLTDAVFDVPFWEMLNNEAQEIAKVVFLHEDYFIVAPPETAQLILMKAMQKRGWSWNKIQSGMKNIFAIFA